MANFYPFALSIFTAAINLNLALMIISLVLITLLIITLIQKTNAHNKLSKQKEMLDSNIQIKQRLLTIIGHDMRAPLNSIYHLIQLLKSDALDKEQKHQLLDNLSIATASGIETLNNIFEWGKSQMNTQKYEPRKLNVNFLAQSNFDLLSEIASQKNITLINQVPVHLNIIGDLGQISFIIRNLLANAIKFSFPGTLVEISAWEESNDQIRICVKDSGTGISDIAIKRILEKEELFSTPGTANEKGSGLGLYLSKEFIKQNGGILYIQSQPQQGSEFSFTLKKGSDVLNEVGSGYD
ncbi:MAG TPA: HAMP domain-containing sensor histidine kinase [Daejeonella sp.]|nr:HAMP domain-containing sensor histidine kinase [Daejeonella sp.]